MKKIRTLTSYCQLCGGHYLPSDEDYHISGRCKVKATKIRQRNPSRISGTKSAQRSELHELNEVSASTLEGKSISGIAVVSSAVCFISLTVGAAYWVSSKSIKDAIVGAGEDEISYTSVSSQSQNFDNDTISRYDNEAESVGRQPQLEGPQSSAIEAPLPDVEPPQATIEPNQVSLLPNGVTEFPDWMPKASAIMTTGATIANFDFIAGSDHQDRVGFSLGSFGEAGSYYGGYLPKSFYSTPQRSMLVFDANVAIESPRSTILSCRGKHQETAKPELWHNYHEGMKHWLLSDVDMLRDDNGDFIVIWSGDARPKPIMGARHSCSLSKVASECPPKDYLSSKFEPGDLQYSKNYEKSKKSCFMDVDGGGREDVRFERGSQPSFMNIVSGVNSVTYGDGWTSMIVREGAIDLTELIDLGDSGDVFIEGYNSSDVEIGFSDDLRSLNLKFKDRLPIKFYGGGSKGRRSFLEPRPPLSGLWFEDSSVVVGEILSGMIQSGMFLDARDEFMERQLRMEPN